MSATKPAKQPLVFISHATRDQKIAAAFADMLTAVSMGMIHTFRSSDKSGVTGIRYGDDYFKFIFDKLQNATNAVCILTDENADRPWILYEAGVAKGYGTVQVAALTINTKLGSSTGTPFTHFQNIPFEETAVRRFVIQLLEDHFPTVKSGDPVVQEAIISHVRQFMEETVASLTQPASPDLQDTLERVYKLLTARELRTMYVGQYPESFKEQVISILQKAEKSIKIACDYPAYGFLTNQPLYIQYKNVLTEKAKSLLNGLPADKELRARTMSLTVSASTTRSEMIKYPVPESEDGWVTFMSNEIYKPGREAMKLLLNKHFPPNSYPIKDLESFYTAIAKVQELELNSFQFPWYEVEERMPIFAWIVDGTRAAFAIPTYLEGEKSIEHAFSTDDPHLIKALGEIVEGYRRKARTPAAPPAPTPALAAS